jgi:hypothetical protein
MHKPLERCRRVAAIGSGAVQPHHDASRGGKSIKPAGQAAYRSPPMLLRLTAAADTLVVDTLAVADTLRPDISGPGTDRGQEWWFGVDPRYTSGLDFTRAHSPWEDTSGISGMAAGGITALARAGYGRTITASICGLATNGPERHFDDLNSSSQL